MDGGSKDLIKGSLYLLLRNAGKLSDKQSDKLEKLLNNNQNFNLVYVLKASLTKLYQSIRPRQFQ